MDVMRNKYESLKISQAQRRSGGVERPTPGCFETSGEFFSKKGPGLAIGSGLVAGKNMVQLGQAETGRVF
jgi:hypothetical protein